MPPCPQCPGKTELLPVADTAVRFWSLLDLHERRFREMDGYPMALSLGAVRGLAEEYGLSREMRELIVTLEHVVLPLYRDEHERRSKAKKKAG